VNWELVREGHGEPLVMSDNKLCLEPEWYRIGVVAKRRRVQDFQALAQSFEKEGRREGAVETYQKGIRSFPDARALYEDLGALYLGMNLPGFTVDVYLAYLERRPEDAGVRSRLARAYEKMAATGKVSLIDYKEKARAEWRKLAGTEYDGEARQGLARLSN
jgi:predicted Zn-dependent protease